MRILSSLLALVLAPLMLQAESGPRVPSAGESFMMAAKRVEQADSLRRDRAMYRWSVGALIGANIADAASSWGKREGNPALRNGDGRFGWNGVAIKAGITGSVLLTQRYILRKHPSQYKGNAWINYSFSGLLTGVAIRNWQIPK